MRRSEFRLRYVEKIHPGDARSIFLIPRLSLVCAWCGEKPTKWHLKDGLWWCWLCEQPHRGPDVDQYGGARFNDTRPNYADVWFELTPEQVKAYGDDERRQDIECGNCHEMIQLLVCSKERPTSCRCDACQANLEQGWKADVNSSAVSVG